MKRVKYDKNGIWIPFKVSKEDPCPICLAEVNNAHTGYCPNNKLNKEGD
jgi:hypothetical protein